MANRQGNKKLKNFFKDLIINEHFIKAVKDFDVEKNIVKSTEMVFEICSQYGIDIYDFWSLRDAICSKDKQEIIFQNNQLADSCRLIDDYDCYLNDNDHPYNKAVQEDIYLSTRYRAFPISIGVSPLASDRDIIDFVRKNWDRINDALSQYRTRNRINIRSKKKEGLV